MLGVWHAILVRLGRVPAWVRSAIRVGLALLILSELARIMATESLPWRARGIPIGQLQHVVQETQGWTMWLDYASVILLGLVTTSLVALTVLRVIRGAPEPAPELES